MAKATVKNETETEIDETPKKFVPKVFMSKDAKIECAVKAFYDLETGALEHVIPYDGNETTDEEILAKYGIAVHKFWFSRVSYNKLNSYRNQSMIYNKEDKINTINLVKLHEYFWIFHLVDWNLTDEYGNAMKLKFDPNKALSDESIERLYSIPASILDMVMLMFDKKISI